MAGTARTRAQLTTEPGAPFRTGNVPTNGDFQNLVASHFSLVDDDASRITVDPVSQDFLEAELGALPLEAGGVRALLAGVVNKLVSLLPFTVRTVDTIAELRALAGDTRRAVYVRGYWAPGDEGGGVFRFDAARVAEDDGGLCIAGWVRIRDGQMLTPQMFGALMDGVADDTAAFSAAMAAAGSGTVVVAGILNLPNGYTKPSSFTCPSLIGVGATVKVGTSPITIVGGSGVLCGAVWQGIAFVGNSANTLIEVAGQGGIIFRDCSFSQAGIGILAHNRDSGMFTEFVVAEACSFNISCLNALTYRVSSGNASFHGTGLRHCTINTPASGTGICVSIESGSLVYNAPLSVQVWGNANAVLISSSVTSLRNSFYGVITVERFVGTLTIASASDDRPIYFVGNLIAMNEHIALGHLVICESAVLVSTGGMQVRGGRFAKKFTLTTGSNVIGLPYNLNEACTLYAVFISAINYDYRYIVAAWHGELVSSAVAVLATLRQYNPAGYGAPTFGIDSSGRLIITNALYPASGVSVEIEMTQLGQSMNTARILS